MTNDNAASAAATRLRWRHPANRRRLDLSTRGERIADQVTSVFGSWRFIILQTMIVGAWIALNLVAVAGHWDPYLPRRLGRLLTDAGFTVARRHVHPMLNAGYDEHTFSAAVIGLVVDFVPGRAAVTEAEAQAWRPDLVGLGADYFFSLNRYLFLAVK